jgi:pilus assembly protein CpaB
MPAKTILTILFVISLGVVVLLGLRALPQRSGTDTGPAREILIAAKAMPHGTFLRAEDVAWQPLVGVAKPDQLVHWASTASSSNVEREQQMRAEVYGAALRTSVEAGEPISRSAIVKPEDRDFLQVVLLPAARAIAIPVATGGASTGILYPGDHVDVVLTQSFKNDQPLTRRSVGETVVENLRVLAIGSADSKATTSGNGFGRTVTLEVTPEQAERINVAAELGKLSLTLRSIIVADTVAGFASGGEKARIVRPVWAGDVSPALGSAMPPEKVITAEPPVVQVIRGNKAVAAKFR